MGTDRTPRIILDVSSVIDEEVLHTLLAKTFDFPGYYGKNWDAFFDCIMYDPEMRMPQVLEIEGFDSLASRLPDSAARFKGCLDDYEAEYSDRTVHYK